MKRSIEVLIQVTSPCKIAAEGLVGLQPVYADLEVI